LKEIALRLILNVFEHMKTYPELIEHLKLSGINPIKGDFYDFEGFPLEEEFDKFYRYCQEYLERQDLGFDISPAAIYYCNNISENALATVTKGLYLVEIFKGSIFAIYDFNTAKNELFEKEVLIEFRDIIRRGDIEPGYVLFQFVSLFFLYHEVGHLIQRRIGSTDYTEYLAFKCEGEEIEIRHMREHDADWFAANQLAFHVIDFARRCKPKDQSDLKTLLEKNTSMALAGIYMNFIRWAGNYPTIYFQEHCHPHPSIRLSYSVIYLLDTLTSNIGFQLDQKAVLKNAIKISEQLMIEPGKNVIEDYSKELFEKIGLVETYISKIRADSNKYPYLSRKALIT
jgi:hypothetical protein